MSEEMTDLADCRNLLREDFPGIFLCGLITGLFLSYCSFFEFGAGAMCGVMFSRTASAEAARRLVRSVCSAASEILKINKNREASFTPPK